jgi:hypothetical protein
MLIHVGHEGHAMWPFEIEDHGGKMHQIYLYPGEVGGWWITLIKRN